MKSTRSTKKATESPYPGLRFYAEHERLFFAGRDEDALKCTVKLGSAPILVLHGRSGCGKSSFLRAGVKPRLSEAVPGRTFPQNFSVVRCTENPLREFALMLIGVCEDFIRNDRKSFWKPKDAVEAEDIEEFAEAFAAKKDEMCSNAARTHDVLYDLSRLLKSAPVFVVDQAEEVFTHAEKIRRDLAAADDGSEEERQRLTREKEEQATLAKEFFEFLRLIAKESAGGAKIIISLRTEYKGQFDDAIPADSDTNDKFTSYYLEDLSVDGLTAAIERPTLKEKEWRRLPDVGEEVAPFDRWGFCFEEGVARKLAQSLINTDKVPEGGVLPTLQIACMRLWEQASQASQDDKGTITINELQLGRIGQIDTQVQEYISQRLEEACRMMRPWPNGEADAVEEWHRILCHKLVEVQADGRAVTIMVARDDLEREALGIFGFSSDHDPSVKKIRKVIDYLLEDNVALLNHNEKDDILALGHDSVALSLNKWSIRYNRDDQMMMRMKMNGTVTPDKYKAHHLFPALVPGVRKVSKNKIGKPEEPHVTRITIHRDDHWDRQFPHFAEYKGFAERLGIIFVTDREDLDMTDKGSDAAPKNWPELSRRLAKAEKDAFDDRYHQRENARVMVAADWHSFPRIDPVKDGAKGAVLKEVHQRQVLRWTDVLVTNLFTGNGLIGPMLPVKDKLDRNRALSSDDPGAFFEPVIHASFTMLLEQRGRVQCHDALARNFLIESANLVCGKYSKAAKYVKDSDNVSIFDRADDDSSPYPLADWFLGRGDSGNDRPRFIVGTAATRAVALQAGGHLYFATSELTRVVRSRINGIRGARGDTAQEEEDLSSEVQKVIKHTTWQLGLAPTQWDQGRNRAMVLRLASIGYFTAEYIRSHADEFVRFIRDRINERLADDEAESSFKGVRMNRESIRESVRDCYSMYRFDEIGMEFYDIDSTVAYLTNHAEYESMSAASEIYNTLAALRQETLVNYEAISRMILWLKARGGYRLESDTTKRVIELKECAWNNYRIFNFFDAARFMGEASLLLQQVMEDFEYGGTND